MTKRSFAMALAMALVAAVASSAPCRAGTYLTTVAAFNDLATPADDFEATFTGTSGTITDVTVLYSSGVSTTTQVFGSGASVEINFTTPLAEFGTVLFSFDSTTGPVGLSAAYWTYKTGDMVVATKTVIIASVDPVPEPGSMALLGIGVVGLFGWRRLSRRKIAA
jgi:PEP-CTERM motif